MRKLKNAIFGLFIILLFAGLYFIKTTNYFDDYGRAYNKVRKELGILEIPENWKTQVNGTATKLWMPENMKEVEIGRLGKEVVLDDKSDKIEFERDRIINNTTEIKMVLEVTYRFDQESKLTYKYFELENDSYVNEKELTKIQFTEMIVEWGIDLNE